MALGGGTWQTQNKVLPGTYINFTSLAKASASLSDRGVAAAPFMLSWGPEDRVFEVTADDFRKNSMTIFGYPYDAPQMLCLREIFCNAVKVFCYRLGSSTAAQSTHATAKYGGVRGNDITIKIAASVDSSGYYVVGTYVGGTLVDEQTVQTAAALRANDFVSFKSFTMAATAGTPLTGGADDSDIDGDDYQDFLDAIESYSFNTLCCPVSDSTTCALFINFTKRMRDELGAKFQLVTCIADNANHEGIIYLGNILLGESALLYWVTGAEAAAAVNKSLTNRIYDGEVSVYTDYTQTQLETAIKAGKFMLHSVNGEVRVLEDINSLITYTDEKGEIFRSNQTVRVCDQIANDTAALFNTRYIGIVPNDGSGRATLWNDVVKLIQQLEVMRAVENFDTDTVSVSQGERKGSVVLTINGLNIVNAMSQLYMSVIIQ